MEWCKKHTHSTQERAFICHMKEVDKRIQRVGPRTPIIRNYRNGKPTRRGGIEILVFTEDLNTSY